MGDIDMVNPKFKVVLLFTSAVEFKVVREYAVKNGREWERHRKGNVFNWIFLSCLCNSSKGWVDISSEDL